MPGDMNDDPDSRCSLHLEVAVRDPAWRHTVADAEALAAQAANAALSTARLAKFARSGVVEAALTLADDALSRELNHRYRDQDKPTNVLSFSGTDGPGGPGRDAPRFDNRVPPGGARQLGDGPPLILGDVVIARQTTVREAGELGKPLKDHLRHLVVHGMLHLLGYDHQQAAAAEEMERLEVEILATLGVPDPYHLTDAMGADEAAIRRQRS
jgi:probable rRNA maturation factor